MESEERRSLLNRSQYGLLKRNVFVKYDMIVVLRTSRSLQVGIVTNL